MKEHHTSLNIRNACSFLGVSRSGFYASINRPVSNHIIEDEVLKDEIKNIFTNHKGRYGTRRIKVVLKNEGHVVSRRRIGRLLKEQGLYTKGTKRKYINYTKNIKYISENIVEQKFDISLKNTVWYGDITYIPTTEGTLYCSVYIDSFTRKCIGYSIEDHMRDSLVIDSLHETVKRENPPKGLIIHTDQGSQYTGSNFYEYIKTSGFIHSQSRRGNPYDNAVMESFFKSFKREVLTKHNFKSKAIAIVETVEYLENYYNNKRMHSSLDYLTPSEYEIRNS